VGTVEECGQVAGEGVAEDATLMLYCACVTERYVKEGKFRAEGRVCADGPSKAVSVAPAPMAW